MHFNGQENFTSDRESIFNNFPLQTDCIYLFTTLYYTDLRVYVAFLPRLDQGF